MLDIIIWAVFAFSMHFGLLHVTVEWNCIEGTSVSHAFRELFVVASIFPLVEKIFDR